MEAPQSSILQHTERGEVFVEEFLFYFILIPIARSQDLLLLSVWNCTCSCRHFVDMLEPKTWESAKFWGFTCIYIRRKPDWNDKVYNWKFVEIETLRLKGGIILKKTSKDHNEFGFSGFVYHRRFSFFTSEGSEQPPNWLMVQGSENDHLGTS